MADAPKNQEEILSKLNIPQLTPMQEEAHYAIHANPEVILLSPTGSGKTLAFLLPVIQTLDRECQEVQALILAPSRELAIQIEQVAREMGAGIKINAVYGGRAFSKDKTELKHPPAVLIGTPGRIADHLRRGTFSTDHIQTLVLDEFDKSLEIGFTDQMREILEALPKVNKKILTSATQEVEIPDFVGLRSPVSLSFLEDSQPQIQLRLILSPDRDKLETLVDAFCQLGHQPGIVFCNFKDSLHLVSDVLKVNGIPHGCYHGDMEQHDRERALIKFRNGTHQLLVATDLAARGIDIPEIQFILHFELPNRSHEFIHRNGRTARMNRKGTAYILHWPQRSLPPWLQEPEVESLIDAEPPQPSPWTTVFISGGRKDKISKGDIAGFFIKQGKLDKEDLSTIEIKQDCAFVGIRKDKAGVVVRKLDNHRLKKKKVRLTEI